MDKKIVFHKPSFDEASKLAAIYALRDNMTCDSTVLDTYIWKDQYNAEVYIGDEAAFILMKDQECYFAAMPYCREEELPKYFGILRNYFNEELKSHLRINLADEDAIKVLGLLGVEFYSQSVSSCSWPVNNDCHVVLYRS